MQCLPTARHPRWAVTSSWKPFCTLQKSYYPVTLMCLVITWSCKDPEHTLPGKRGFCQKSQRSGIRCVMLFQMMWCEVHNNESTWMSSDSTSITRVISRTVFSWIQLGESSCCFRRIPKWWKKHSIFILWCRDTVNDIPSGLAYPPLKKTGKRYAS